MILASNLIFSFRKQDAWCLFVVYMALSRFGNMKLGKENEQPAFNDITWFAMLFCSGIGIGRLSAPSEGNSKSRQKPKGPSN